MAAIKTMEDWQRRKMFALARELKVDKKKLYTMAGVESLKNLPYDKAQDVIKSLSYMAKPYNKSSEKTKQKSMAVPGMITKPQQDKVWALMFELEKHDKQVSEAGVRIRLSGIIKKELKIAAPEHNPFVWMNFESGHKLIEILKGYVATAKKK